MENRMKEIAKMLGVELDEKFDIVGSEFNPYIITNEGLFDCDGDLRTKMLWKLLAGKSEITEHSCVNDKQMETYKITYKQKIYGETVTDSFIKTCEYRELFDIEQRLLEDNHVFLVEWERVED